MRRRDLQKEIIADAIRMGLMPAGTSVRFFRPTQAFVAWAAKAAGARLVYDVGAGTGHVSATLSAAGVKVVAVDLSPSEASVWQTVSADGGALSYRRGSVVMLCRPCHGDFPGRVVRCAVESGAEVWYVGLDRNVEDDVDVELFSVQLCGAGEDGEKVWVMPVTKGGR